MANQFQLFGLRKFSSMFGTQFLGAFNDNVFKQSLILILTFTAASQMQVDISVLTNLAAMLFILPYFLFSSVAGQVADKYEKSALTRKIKLLEIAIMIFAAIGFALELYWLLFVALFLLGSQSTFFGPIKYAYLPQVMKSDELVTANGFFQMGTSLSILVGMIVAGLLTQLDNSFVWISTLTLLIAALGYFCASKVPETPSLQPDLKINWNIFSTSWQTVCYLYSLPFLFFTVMGTSWFWFYGATFLTQTPEFSKEILHGDESVVILMLGVFSLGVSLGSVLCKTLTKNRISIRLLPFGILGLSIFAADLYFSLAVFDVTNGALLDVSGVLALSGSYRVLADLFFLGFSGGIYIVPLYSLMQAYAPVNHRARIIGANNIFNALFMVTSAIFSIIILSKLKLDIPTLFAVTGVLNVLFGVFLYTNLQKHRGSLQLQLNND